MKIIVLLSILLINICFAIGQVNKQVGLITNLPGNSEGYVLFSPMNFTSTYIIDKCGKLVKEWKSKYKTVNSTHLDNQGNLWRTAQMLSKYFNAGGKGGIIEKFDWNNKLLWTFLYSDSNKCLHHDFVVLKNGNILALTWEKITLKESEISGKKSKFINDSLWSEKIIEVQPIGVDSFKIVWEWRVWDHLIQDGDSLKNNYGEIIDHPEKVNINYSSTTNEVNKSDWIHLNSIDYNDKLDQIIVSSLEFCEIWIIDHSTSTLEAKSNNKGKYNKGGDLLYRWGNSRTYNRGSNENQKLFGQHDARWITEDENNNGKISIFNNGNRRTGGVNYSTAEIISTPNINGEYTLTNNNYKPDSADWIYMDIDPIKLYSSNLSGVNVLYNGNVLITVGNSGTIFEINQFGKTLWKYQNPVGSIGPVMQGNPVPGPLLFKSNFYAKNYDGFVGKQLISKDPIEVNPITYECETSLVEFDLVKNLNEEILYPNPINSNNKFITILNKNTSYDKAILYDVTGKIMMNFSVIGNSIDLKNLSLTPGKYFVELKGLKKNKLLELICN